MSKVYNLILVLGLIFSFLLMFLGKVFLFLEIQMFSLNSFNWLWVIKIDAFSSIFSSVVLIISLLIFFYSMEYMKMEKEIVPFFIYLWLFVISMLVLIFSFNLSSILLGWDGLGVTSFMLILYYNSVKSVNSSLITILINRMGDLMIIFSIITCMIFISWNSMFWYDKKFFGLILLMAASLTKSAQIPFSYWLPKAMAAPTPVSSLVHSSTLVTAGAYLMFRLNIMWTTIFLISSLTLLVSSVMGVLSFDFKEIIAFSTMSHISFMFMSLYNSNSFGPFFFHLNSHALFKALLFMCSGYLIFFNSGLQDIRKIDFMLFNYKLKLSFMIASYSMMGLPFLSGFYSKEMVIEDNLYSKFNLIFSFSILLTSLYTMRLIIYMHMNTAFGVISLKSKFMINSIYILTWFSILFGSLFQWLCLSLTFIYHCMYMKLVMFFYLIFGLFSMMNEKPNFMKLFYYNLSKVYKIFMEMMKKNNFFFVLEKGWLKFFVLVMLFTLKEEYKKQ
uniref:NADH-ubiquinone oxidoreductase chain 5 n=1 Tax=Liposcelis paeta TaxID=209927 RepID=A0A096X745_9NEOP|nr:NADH dehydrogenase subunit 5 [Liposcelis paeta]